MEEYKIKYEIVIRYLKLMYEKGFVSMEDLNVFLKAMGEKDDK